MTRYKSSNYPEWLEHTIATSNRPVMARTKRNRVTIKLLLTILLWTLLITTNCLWFWKYQAQSYELDRTDGARVQAEQYIRNGCRN